MRPVAHQTSIDTPTPSDDVSVDHTVGRRNASPVVRRGVGARTVLARRAGQCRRQLGQRCPIDPCRHSDPPVHRARAL